jgi:RNA polymerase sigma-70 factor (ECF subfamily)
VEEGALVRRLLAGGDADGAATAALRELGPAILGWLRALHGPDDGDEVFAEFAERLWKGLPGFRGESPLRTWAYRIAWNASHSFRSDAWQRRRQRLATSAASRLAADVSRSLGPSADEPRLRKLRDLLPPGDHTLLVLRLDREMTWDEIAAVLSGAGEPVSAPALRKRYERLKEKLARLARDEGLADE